MSRLLWGAVGIGRFFTGTIAPAMQELDECRLVAVVSRDSARAEAVASQFGASFSYTSYREMLANPEIDAVYISTPNALHADQVVAAAEAGKHVLAEKPLANSAADAWRAVVACEQAGVALGVNFHNRFLPWVRDATRVVGEGEIGEVEMVEVEVGSGPRAYDNWRADPALAGLGSVHNVGVHAFDFLRMILDAEPLEVSAMFEPRPGSGAVEMLATVLIRFDNGVVAYCNCNERIRHPRNEITIHGTRGRLVGVGLTRSREAGVMVHLNDEGEAVIEYPSSNAHRDALRGFARAVIDGETPSPSGIDGLRSAQLCEAIAQSATVGRLVAVDYESGPAL